MYFIFLKNERIKLLELKLEQKYQEDGFRMCSKKENDEKVFTTTKQTSSLKNLKKFDTRKKRFFFPFLKLKDKIFEFLINPPK